MVEEKIEKNYMRKLEEERYFLKEQYHEQRVKAENYKTELKMKLEDRINLEKEKLEIDLKDKFRELKIQYSKDLENGKQEVRLKLEYEQIQTENSLNFGHRKEVSNLQMYG